MRGSGVVRGETTMRLRKPAGRLVVLLALVIVPVGALGAEAPGKKGKAAVTFLFNCCTDS